MKRKMSMIISLSLVGVIALALLIYYFGAFYPTFNSFDKQKEFEIPGLEDGFVPQGLDYVEKDGVFLVSGYMSDGSPSRIYVINKETGVVDKQLTCIKNNEDYIGHSGGIASDGNYVWLVGDKRVETLLYSDIANAQSGTKIEIKSSIETGNGCDFVDVYNNKLIVGEFYRSGKYDTPEQHHIDISDDETTHAVAYAYDIDETTASGIGEISFALTLPDQAQGISFVSTNDGEKIMISTSWSISSSKLKIYENPLNKESGKTLSAKGKEVPLYELNSGNQTQTISAPAMTEELTVVDDRVFIMFESACKKYKFVNRTRTKNALSIML